MIYAWVVLGFVIGIGVYFYLGKRNENKTPKDVAKESTEGIPGGEIESYDTAPVKDGDAVYWYENGEKKEGTVKVMPVGLQVYDANGNITLDLTHRITKYLGIGDTGTTDGSITRDIKGLGVWWVIPIRRWESTGDPSANIARFYVIDNNTLGWKFYNQDLGHPNVRTRFIYGIY